MTPAILQPVSRPHCQDGRMRAILGDSHKSGRAKNENKCADSLCPEENPDIIPLEM